MNSIDNWQLATTYFVGFLQNISIHKNRGKRKRGWSHVTPQRLSLDIKDKKEIEKKNRIKRKGALIFLKKNLLIHSLSLSLSLTWKGSRKRKRKGGAVTCWWDPLSRIPIRVTHIFFSLKKINTEKGRMNRLTLSPISHRLQKEKRNKYSSHASVSPLSTQYSHLSLTFTIHYHE